ncbi:MAG: hypothetical protein D6771_05645 [Zetaproteobacteria bacterium]|nr:MAG: hypothetical protein D6771_05645 [Zetaproteobacteria bacterium]
MAGVLAVGQACAAGFLQPNVSPSAASMGGAFVARADDATAAVINPAGFAWQGTGSWMLGQIVDYRQNSLREPGVGVHPNRGAEPNSGFFYLGRMLGAHAWGFSFGYLPLFDLRARWPTLGAGEARWTAELVSLALIHAPSSRWAWALSLDGWRSKVELVHGGAALAARHWAAGGSVALLWRPRPDLSFGMQYRRTPRLKLSAGAQRASVKLPDILRVGASGWNGERLRWAVDLEWQRWSQLHDLSIRPASPRPLRLKDTWSVMAGVAYAFRMGAEYRFGYAYEPAASPSDWDPLVPDQPGHRLSIGIGGRALTLDWDFAFTYGWYPKRGVTGSYPGTLRDRRIAFVMSLGKAF